MKKATVRVTYCTVGRAQFDAGKKYTVISNNATHATLIHPMTLEEVVFTRRECSGVRWTKKPRAVVCPSSLVPSPCS
jgi:hypothetical protein